MGYGFQPTNVAFAGAHDASPPDSAGKASGSTGYHDGSRACRETCGVHRTSQYGPPTVSNGVGRMARGPLYQWHGVAATMGGSHDGTVGSEHPTTTKAGARGVRGGGSGIVPRHGSARESRRAADGLRRRRTGGTLAAYDGSAITGGTAGRDAGNLCAGTGDSGPRTRFQNGQDLHACTTRGTGAASVTRPGWTAATRRAGMAGATTELCTAADERAGARERTAGGTDGIHASDRRHDARATREFSDYRFTSGDGQRDTATSGDTLPITRFRDRS